MEHSLLDLAGVGPTIARVLSEAGFTDVTSIADAEPEELEAVRGIGAARAVSLRIQATGLVRTREADARPVERGENREQQANRLRKKAKRLRREAKRFAKKAGSTKSKKKRKRRLRKAADLEKAARKARRQAKKLLAE